MIVIKSKSQIEKMKKAGAIVKNVLLEVENFMKVGMKTKEVDKFVHDFITKHGGVPSFLGYHGFPASACISIDEEVVHGIPRDKYIEEGQIVSVDVGVFIEGFHGDAARSFLMGQCSEEKIQLVNVTRECFFKALEKATINNRLGDISNAIQTHAESFGYGVVRNLCGHGIGEKLHESPEVLNYGEAGRGLRLQEGLALAIEPMINMGTYKVEFMKDKWTCVTADRKPSGHYENTIIITDGEPLVLTL